MKSPLLIDIIQFKISRLNRREDYEIDTFQLSKYKPNINFLRYVCQFYSLDLELIEILISYFNMRKLRKSLH